MKPVAKIGLKTAKRTQFFGRRHDDLLPANRGQPPQCTSEHRSRDRRRQEKITPKCTSSRPDGRNRLDRRKPWERLGLRVAIDFRSVGKQATLIYFRSERATRTSLTPRFEIELNTALPDRRSPCKRRRHRCWPLQTQQPAAGACSSMVRAGRS